MEATVLDDRYSDLLNRYTGPGKKIIVSFHGEMDQDRVSMLSYTAEHQLETQGARRNTIKRIFNILIELLQNVLLHSASPNHGKPFYFVLAENMDEYVAICANVVSNEAAKKIQSTLDSIKKMSEKQLKNHYIDVLSNDQYSVKGGAGLGLITVALKCGNNFTFNIIPQDGQVSLFEMTAIISDK
ncbi:MAG: SiaB family protein kinase [Bacteroidia bacterium]